MTTGRQRPSLLRMLYPRLIALSLCLTAPVTSSAVAEPAKAAAIPSSPRWPFVAAPPKVKDQGQGGVGLVLEAKPNGVFFQQIVAGGPANRAGLLAGDQLVRIDAWPVPPNAKVPEVAEHIRGKPGTSCEIEVKRAGVALTRVVVRDLLDRMFPAQAKAPLAVTKGFALLASGAQLNLGVQFSESPGPHQPLRYHWRSAPLQQPLGSAEAETGQGLIAVDPKEGALLQLGDWRIELRTQAEGTVWVTASNLPVHEPAGDWLTVQPPWPTLVKPRAAATRKTSLWEGASQLHLRLTSAGNPVGKARISLKLSDEAGLTMDTHAAVSDDRGAVAFAMPKGKYRVVGISPAAAGPGRDVSFSHDLVAPAEALATDAAPTPLQLTARPPATSPIQALDWAQDPRIGQGLPPLQVARWFGLTKPPATLAGKVLLIDVWATWCGPCRATAPLVAELHARLASDGLVVVAASIDRDEQALEDYVKSQLPGGPAVAWVGPEAMEVLETESVPTFLVVDHLGRLRGVHKGTGWKLEQAESWLRSLLAEAKTAEKPAKR